MSEPFLAEIRIFGFNFAPRGWATCDGQILPISQNQSLYSLLGTTYGGDGRTSFALPDLRGRVPTHEGVRPLGRKTGTEIHQLTEQEMPAHDHPVQATSGTGDSPIPTSNRLASFSSGYTADDSSLVNLKPESLTANGGGQAHNNMQPYTTVNVCIALQGLFPSRN